MTTRLIDVIGLPSPDQARRIVLLLGLAGGARKQNGAEVAPSAPRIEITRQQAS